MYNVYSTLIKSLRSWSSSKVSSENLMSILRSFAAHRDNFTSKSISQVLEMNFTNVKTDQGTKAPFIL